MIKFIFILLCALFFFSPSWAQKKADSLFEIVVNQVQKFITPKEEADFLILQSEKPDGSEEEKLAWRQKALIIQRNIGDTLAMGQNLRAIGGLEDANGNNELAFTAYQEALVLLKQRNDYGNAISVLYKLQKSYAKKNQFVNSANCFVEAKEIALKQNDTSRLCSILFREGMFYFRRSAFVKSVELQLQQLDLALEINNLDQIYKAHSGLGTIYEEAFQDYDMAHYHYLEGLKIAKNGNDNGRLAHALINIATTAIYQENYTLALDCLNEARIPSFETGWTVDYYYTRFGLYYEKQKEYKKALEYYKKGIEYLIDEVPQARYQRALSYADMGRVYILLKEYTKAVSICKEGLDYSVDLNHLDGQKVNCSCLSKAYKRLGRKAEAFDYLERLVIINDSLSIEETKKQLQNISFTKLLQTDSIIQVQEKLLLNATYEDGLRKKNREKNIFLVIGLMVLIFAVGMYSRLRFVRKSRALLNIEKNRAERSEQLKNTLYTNITHEFRTPLTVIQGMAESAKSNIENKQYNAVGKSLEMIGRNGKKLLRLINEMLDLAKLESGNMDLKLQQADIIPFVKYLSESFHSFAEKKEINLTVYSEVDNLIMDFDANKLASIVSNLLSNAIKFTPVLGKIIVHLSEIQNNNKHFFIIKVKDNGLGLSKENIANIFNRFYQVDDSSSRSQEGTGIGLALTKELVELLGGTIEVESTIKKGSAFIVQIPVNNNAPQVKEIEFNKKGVIIPTSSSEDVLQQNTESDLPLVLIIEDNVDVAYYLQSCLTETYKTLHAINGSIGIEMAYKNIPDIIISDVMMPVKDGFEVCKTLKSDQRTSHIPIILLTAKASEDDKIEGLEQGADAYLTKPFNQTELSIRLEKLISLRKNLVQKYSDSSFKSLQTETKNDLEAQFLNKVITCIEKNIENSDFKIIFLARDLGLSESQLYRKLKALTNTSTAIFIRSVRLQKAKELLQKKEFNISDVCYKVGFTDPSYFSRVFKDEFGSTPSEI